MKSHDIKKDAKKKPQKTLKERQAEKRLKREQEKTAPGWNQ